MRLLIGALLCVLVVLVIVLFVNRVGERYPLLHAERSREAQSLANLRSYAAREPMGSLLPPGDVQVALREPLLQDILARSLPIRQQFEDGRYEARLDQALLNLEDGLASITLIGRGRMLGPNASPLDVYLRLQTHIDLVEFRPDAGTLRAGLAITAAHVVRTGQGMGPFAAPAARFFSSLQIEDWNRQRPSLEIPIRVDQEVTLPPIQGDLSLDSCRIPLVVAVSALTVFQDRLVISLTLGRDRVPGETPGVAGAGPRMTPEDRQSAEESLGRPDRGGSRLERSALRQRVSALAARDSLWHGLMTSDRDVTAILPFPVLQTLCDRVAQNYLQGARLDFDPDIGIHLDKEIQFKLLGGTVGAGRIEGDVNVSRLQGLLHVAGTPALELLPPDGLRLTTPILVSDGFGRVELDMRWNPSFLVSIVCGGFEFRETLAGAVVPFSHDLQTRIRFSTDRSAFVCRPLVRQDRIAVPCEFTPASLAKVRAALLEQDKLLKCGIVMNADSVLADLRTLIRRKVRFSLPRTLFKPFSVPVSVRQQYDAGDFRINARMEDPQVLVRPEYLRFGFRAALSVQALAQAGARR